MMARPAGVGQSGEWIEGLLDPRAYPHPVDRVELLETHISWILLTGMFAYKVKKPVDLGFVNFSTLALRRYYCAEELRLNRRTAPEPRHVRTPPPGSAQGERPSKEGSPLNRRPGAAREDGRR